MAINDAAHYLSPLKRFVSEYGQPTIAFETVPSEDDTLSTEDVVYDWKSSKLELRFPMTGTTDLSRGSLLLGGAPCK